jgi:hypothetical protein
MGKQICAQCHMPIEFDYLEFEGNPYHPEHLRCAKCDKQLGLDATTFVKRIEPSGESSILCDACSQAFN